LRLLTSAILAIGTLLTSAPAPAQTYDPRYPVCIHIYGEEMGDRIDCIFTSLAQCAGSASGLPAVCLTNPYYASARQAMPTRPNRGRVNP
jgi:Protein of unknown function (DUF3551)